MIGIRFDKARGESYMKALASGGTIDAPPDGWTANEMLALAGCCFAVVFRQGPQLHGALGQAVPKDVREFTGKELTRDIHSAIEFCHLLALHAQDGRWDGKFGPVVQGTIRTAEEGPAEVIPG